MPSLGADMERARVIEWLVKPGDKVRCGDVIVVVETDKGAIEIEIFEDGEIEALVAPVDAELEVGALLARIRQAGEPMASCVSDTDASIAPMSAAPASPEPTVRAPTAPPVVPAQVASMSGENPRVRASPAARRLALARGFDLNGVTGHGPQGAVTLADVTAIIAGTTVTPRQRQPVGFDRVAMRRAIGQAMARAKREIPHYYMAHTFNMTRALEWLSEANGARPVERRLLPAVLLLRACGLALARVPGFNGTYVDGTFCAAEAVHVGWAIALRAGGLIAPAIHDVATRDIDTLMQALRDLVRRARNGGLRGSELADATVTVTSLGERGAETVLPVIHPPQVAMIGFGSLVERAWVVAAEVVPQTVIHVSLAADHRVSDGHAGSQLLAEIERLLNHPEEL